MEAIVRAQRIAPEEVERITVTSVPFATRMAGQYPENMLAAKFSVPYAVAASIVMGRTDALAFHDAAISDPRVRELALKVEVRADAAMSMRRSDYPSVTVAITLRGGRVLSRSTTVVRGGAKNPVSADELVGKFLSLAEMPIGGRGAKDVVEVIAALETLGDIRELTARLVPGAP